MLRRGISIIMIYCWFLLTFYFYCLCMTAIKNKVNKLSRYQLWHLHLLCPPSPRKIRRKNTIVSSTCEQDPCLLSFCHGTQGNLAGGSCPAWQVFSLWEQLTRSDKTTIKNSHSSGSAADSSSSGTCTAPVHMLPGYLTVWDTFSLPVPGTRGECQHPSFTDALWRHWAANNQEISGKARKWAGLFPIPSQHPTDRADFFPTAQF